MMYFRKERHSMDRRNLHDIGDGLPEELFVILET